MATFPYTLKFLKKNEKQQTNKTKQTKTKTNKQKNKQKTNQSTKVINPYTPQLRTPIFVEIHSYAQQYIDFSRQLRPKQLTMMVTTLMVLPFRGKVTVSFPLLQC